MIITCEEKSAQSKYYEVVNVGPYNTLYFPNVDSCLSITYVLENNHLIGGHAGWGSNMQPQINAQRVVTNMNGIRYTLGKKIEKIFFIGDLASYNTNTLLPNGFNAKNVFTINNLIGQSDIYFYSSRRWLSIEKVNTKKRLYYNSIDSINKSFTIKSN